MQLSAYTGTTQSHSADPKRLSLLDLPLNVRRKIYISAGLVRPCPINLNLERNRLFFTNDGCVDHLEVFPPERPDTVTFCGCAPINIPLLRTCRSVRQESYEILYGKNRFIVAASNRSGLAPLENLGSKALSALTNISVCLNDCIHNPQHLSRPWRKYECDCLDRLVQASIVCGCGSQEPDPCEFIDSCGCGAYTCKTTCVCCCEQTYCTCYCHGACLCSELVPIGGASRHDKKILETWSAICNNLAKSITPLRLKLCLTSDVVNMKTSERILKDLYRLPLLADCVIRLGKEVNPSLLQQADAAVHRMLGRDLTCAFPLLDLPFELQYQVLRNTDLVDDRPITISWFGQWSCCKHCSSIADYCCCPSKHSASTVTCRCCTIPVTLFRINKSLRPVAIRLFLEANHFVHIYQATGFVSLSKQLKSFFGKHKLYNSALLCIRTLTIRVQQSYDFEFRRHNWRKRWEDLVKSLNDLNLKKLTLCLDLCYTRDADRGLRDPSPEEVDEYATDVYRILVDPIATHTDGLHRLFLSCSFRRSQSNVDGPDRVSKFEGRLERRLSNNRDMHDNSKIKEVEALKTKLFAEVRSRRLDR